MNCFDIKLVCLVISYLLYLPLDVAHLHLAICRCERELDYHMWSIKCDIAD